MPDLPTQPLTFIERFSGGYLGRAISEAAAEPERANRAFLIERQQSLRTIADATGGRAVLNANNPEASVRPILDESSAYYVLAFDAPDVTPDGRFHAVTVTVNRPRVQVRTRKGYYAEPVVAAPAAGGPAVSLEALSRGLLPERGLPMSIAASPFLGRDGRPIVVVTAGVRAGAAAPGRDSAETTTPTFEPIEILTSAFRDGQKDVDWQRQRLSIAMPRGAAEGGLRYESISTLSLNPGNYEVRVAARHERTDDVGSVHTFVDVPDFEAQPLSLSGLVLFDRDAPTATPAEALRGVLDTAPTTRRGFIRTDQVSALARVYQKRDAPAQPITLAFRILDAALNEVTATRLVLAPDQFTGSGADARYALPLDTLASGAYVLRLETSAGQPAQHRDVRFTMK